MGVSNQGYAHLGFVSLAAVDGSGRWPIAVILSGASSGDGHQIRRIVMVRMCPCISASQ
jgi:hypothetical protein